MTSATIIRKAQSDGVSLTLSPAGTIKATGDGAAVNRWLGVIREHKAEIIDVLKVGAGDTATASRWWLIHYPDRDPVEVACCPEATHADILERHPDADARDYFIGRAALGLPKPDPFPDDRRTCTQCANLIVGKCQAAKRSEMVASRNYEPIRELSRRCEGYAPGADDPDRRHGRGRWPELIQKGYE